MTDSHPYAPHALAEIPIPIAGSLPALDNTYGAVLLGAAFGLMFYGLTVHQTYSYFRLYPTDISVLIWLVLVIFVLGTFHTVLIVTACYYFLVTEYFNPLAPLAGHWSARLLIPTTGVTIFICQCFYARRVWFLGSRYRYIVGIAAIIMLVMLGFTTAATVDGFILSFNDWERGSWMISAVFGCAILTDAMLTTTLIWTLLRSRTGFRRTDSIIEIIVVYTINTGLLTSMFGLLVLLFAIILPGNFIYLGISIVGTNLYANSVLAVLNSRRALSDRMLQAFEMGSFEPRHAPNSPHTAIESWDVPQLPVVLPVVTDTHVSFAMPTETMTTSESSTAGDSESSRNLSSARRFDGPDDDTKADKTLPFAA